MLTGDGEEYAAALAVPVARPGGGSAMDYHGARALGAAEAHVRAAIMALYTSPRGGGDTLAGLQVRGASAHTHTHTQTHTHTHTHTHAHAHAHARTYK